LDPAFAARFDHPAMLRTVVVAAVGAALPADGNGLPEATIQQKYAFSWATHALEQAKEATEQAINVSGSAVQKLGSEAVLH